MRATRHGRPSAREFDVHQVIADLALRMQSLAVPAKSQEDRSGRTPEDFRELVEQFRREVQAYCYRMRYEPVPGFDSGADEGPERVPCCSPTPDRLLDPDTAPDAAAVSRETLELVFLTAIQHLPPRQRAVLLLRDVLDWSAADTAAQLDTTVAVVNNDLPAPRPVLREHLPAPRSDWTASGPRSGCR